MMRSLRRLEIFLTVAELQSFSGAARQLYIAQSAVSSAIAKLEGELELRLFQRTDGGAQLTAEGRVLQDHAREILKQVDDTVDLLSSMRGLQTGQVRIGTPAMLASYVLADLLVAFRAQFPGLSIETVDAGTRRIGELLLAGELDLGIVSESGNPPGLTVQPFIEEEMLVCVAPRHRLAGRRRVTLKDLARERLVIHGEGYLLRELVAARFEAAGLQPGIDVETNLVPLMARLVRTANNVGFCLRSVAEREGLVGIPLNPPAALRFGLAWRENHHLSAANAAFVDFLLKRRGQA